MGYLSKIKKAVYNTGYSVIILVMSFAGCKGQQDNHCCPMAGKRYTKIKDCCGQKVILTRNVHKIVDLSALDGIRTLVTLKSEDKLVGINSEVTDFMFGHKQKQYACWFAVPKVAPGLKSIINVGNFREPCTELISSLNPDVIFAKAMSSDFAEALKEQTGLPVVCIGASGALDFKMLEIVARVVGKEKRASDLKAYAQKKIRFIRRQTSLIPPDQRVKVFYWVPPVLGPPKTIAPYDPIDIAGGVNLAEKADVKPYETYETTREQVAVWNPDIILLHWWSKTDIGVKIQTIVRDPVLETVTAVKNNQVFYSRGFMLGWDPAMGLCEVYFMAKLFYPRRFKGLDVEKECNEILKIFYGRDGLYTDLLANSDLCLPTMVKLN